MEELKPNEQRAKTAILLIWIVMALEIMSLISGFLQFDLLQTIAKGGYISNETATTNDSREQIIAIIYLIAFIISGITFIQWFRRAYFNLHLKVNNLSHSESWAAKSWFVPFVNLYLPYQIMKELFHETKELLIKNGLTISENSMTKSLGWWWALWIINNFIGQFVFRYSLKAETVDELTISTLASIFANIIGIPLALITIKIIKEYSNIEPLLNELNDEDESMNDYIISKNNESEVN
jgi:hypothetical protein